MTTLGIIVALWKRPRLSALVLNRARRAAEASGLDHVLVAVVSDEESRRVARGVGWSTVTAPNIPLSNKHNAGVEAMRGYVDAVMVLGSDDMVDDAYVRNTTNLIVRGIDFVGILDCAFLDRRGVTYFGGYDGDRRGEPMGVGRTISKKILDAVDWKLWDDGKSRGLDSSMWRRLQALRVWNDAQTCIATMKRFGTVLDVKVPPIVTRLDDIFEAYPEMTRIESGVDAYAETFRDEWSQLAALSGYVVRDDRAAP